MAYIFFSQLLSWYNFVGVRGRTVKGATHLVDWRGGDEHHPRFRVDGADVRHHLSQVCLVFLEGHFGGADG